MIRLRIKNFGPIHEGLTDDDGWIYFKRVTVFIGNQGSGKSTVAKLFSTFSWMEKALVRGDYAAKDFERKGRFKKLLAYHRLEHYGRPETQIDYEGEAFSFRVKSDDLKVTDLGDAARASYPLPQVMYVPAERNFIAYVRHPKELKLSSEALKEFLAVFEDAKAKMSGSLQLPINGTELEYDRLNDILRLKGSDHKVHLTDASSGFQSLVPLYLTSQHLARSVQPSDEPTESMSSDEQMRFKKVVESIYKNDALTEEQLRLALSALAARFNKTAFVNIVEEPEQNLFPSSQWQVLTSLLGFNDQRKHNRLVLTTHSPYIVSYLTLSAQAHLLGCKLSKGYRASTAALFGSEARAAVVSDLRNKLKKIVPAHARIAPSELAIYESVGDSAGELRKLPTLEDGVPSDGNTLNGFLRQGNIIFDKLLELEEELQMEEDDL